MADDHDDDATRIYRPYGSPPPDPAEDTTPSDPFAPAAPSSPAADPFAPEPAAADPFAPSTANPDPFTPAAVESDDPFRQPEPSGADPFAPAAPSTPPANDPFAPAASSTPAPADPFAPDASSRTNDPFAPADPDPFRAPAPPSAGDPFAPNPPPVTPPPAAPDPFAPISSSSPKNDPFENDWTPSVSPDPPPSSRTPLSGGDWNASPADPFAPAPTPAPAPGPDRADPFAQSPSTGTDDPFAAYQGPGIRSGAGMDSGFHAAPVAGVEVELPKAFGAEETLAGAFTPVFSLILQIRASDDLGDATSLRQRIEALLSESAQAARRTGANDVDVDEATFCLIAFLDEAILSSTWHGRDGWSAQPLQLAHYDRYDAGERFFDKLKALLEGGGTRRAVLEVYYLCLALGFKGRYAIHGREVLRRLVDDLYARLSASNPPGALAPRGTSREVAAQAEKAGLPTWALWVGAAVLVAVIYLVLSLMLSSAAGETADDLRTLSAQSE